MSTFTPPDVPALPTPKTSGLGVTSLIFGVISVLGGVLLFLPPIAAIVLGHLTLSHCKRDPLLKGRALGLAGLIMGYVMLASLPVIGLLAAMAIPAFQKVRSASLEKAMQNDARQIGAAAQMFFLEHEDTQKVSFGIDPKTGAISGPLNAYVSRISVGTTAPDNVFDGRNDSFMLQNQHVNNGQPVIFDAEGRRRM
jgi:type II secretory pathway pseudopilin PulG